MYQNMPWTDFSGETFTLAAKFNTVCIIHMLEVSDLTRARNVQTSSKEYNKFNERIDLKKKAFWGTIRNYFPILKNKKNLCLTPSIPSKELLDLVSEDPCDRLKKESFFQVLVMSDQEMEFAHMKGDIYSESTSYETGLPLDLLIKKSSIDPSINPNYIYSGNLVQLQQIPEFKKHLSSVKRCNCRKCRRGHRIH